MSRLADLSILDLLVVLNSELSSQNSSHDDVVPNAAEISELANQLGSQHGGNPTIDKVARMIRPSNSSVNSFAHAVKRTLKSSILENYSAVNKDTQGKLGREYSAGDAPVIVAKFEDACDRLQRMNPVLINPLLGCLAPLSFTKTTIVANSDFHQTNEATRAQERAEIEALALQVKEVRIPHSIDDIPLPKNEEFALSESDKKVLEKFWVNKEVELLLLRDLIYIFQDIDGKYIRYDSRSDSYTIVSTLKLPTPVKDLVYSLCEIGWLFKHINAYLKQFEQNIYVGLIVQAFSFSIQDELHDYYRLLAVLEQETQRMERQQSMSSSMSAESSQSQQPDQRVSGLTLLRLKAWMDAPLERLVTLAKIVDVANVLNGGALISKLHAFSNHGDSIVTMTLERIMNHVMMPMNQMMIRWILYGELHDAQQEFFIGVNSANNNINNISNNISNNNNNNNNNRQSNVWSDIYYLRQGMLPSFLPQSLANHIMVIGKTINFINICMKNVPKMNKKYYNYLQSKKLIRIGFEKQWKPVQINNTNNNNNNSNNNSEKINNNNNIISSNNNSNNNNIDDDDDIFDDSFDISQRLFESMGSEIESALISLRNNDGSLQLSQIVNDIYYYTNKRLLNLLESRFYLSLHLQALKKYILLSQGDFVTCLIDMIGPELKKRANQLFRHNLTGVVEGALRSSNAQYEPPFIFDRIGVRLLEACQGDSGWEVFSLDYFIDTPLNAVVNMSALAKYRTAFHMLWRLKRVAWSLSESWRQMMIFTHNRGEKYLPKLRSLFHKCNLITRHMLHVINNFSEFIMFEVLETSWNEFARKLSDIRSLDDVIVAHEMYLSTLLDRALLTAKHEILNLQILQLFQCILKFCSLEESLITDSQASIARKRANLGQESDRSLSFEDGSIEGVPSYIINRLEESLREYDNQYQTVIQLLKEQGDGYNDYVRFLTFRLDFNDFHANQTNARK